MLLMVLAGCGRPAPAELVVFADRAVVVRDGRVDAVLDDPAAAEPFVGPDTRVLRGDRVTAGMVDAHAHPLGLGRTLSELDLVGVGSYAETLWRVAGAAGSGWLFGRGWDQNDWSDPPAGGWPLAADLERIHPGRPIALRRVDGHATWASPAALASAGIGPDTPDPDGGRIVRDADGRPTGVLIDAAVDLLKPPAPSPEARRDHLRLGVRKMLEVGLTGAHQMGASDEELLLLEAADRAGELPVRIWVYVDPGTRAANRLAAQGPWAGDHLAVVGVKAYADGALGSRGAWLSAPYTDEPGTVGNRLTSPEALAELAVTTLGGGASVAVHAIGDRAVTEALDAFAAARAAHPERADVPLRIEHAQVVRPEDLPRFAALGVVASVQPSHATSDAPWAEARLGPERLRWSYAWRALADAGAPLALGSDFPIETPDPGHGLWAATTRGGWRTDQALTLDEALAGFTSGAARAVRADDRLGALAVGRPADLTVWTVEGDRWVAVAAVVDGRTP